MANAEKVKDRYYNALNNLYPKLRDVPSTRQLVAMVGGSNSTAEKYIRAWCLENNIVLPAKEKRALNPGVEEAIEAEIEKRTLEACTSYNEEVTALSSSNLDLQETVESLREQLQTLGERLEVLATQNQQYIGQIRQLERDIWAVKEESRTTGDKAEKIIEEFRQKAQEADTARRKAEAELAAFPENNKRAEADQLIAQVLAKALEREVWYASQVERHSKPENQQSKTDKASSAPRQSAKN
jgi:predicted RNase H-like nuclease (RuvC/YqgF family)